MEIAPMRSQQDDYLNNDNTSWLASVDGEISELFPLQMKSYMQLKLAQSMVVFSREEHPK